MAYPNYLDWRRHSHAFTDMGAFRSDDFNFTGSGLPEQLPGEYVTASLFPVLGVRPVLGRTFLPDEDVRGAACSAIISYGLWEQRFGRDRNVISKKLTLNGESCAIVGVLPKASPLSDRALVFIPIEQMRAAEFRMREDHMGLQVIGRLRPGVTLKAAQTEMASIAGVLAQQYPATNATHSADVIDMKHSIVGSIRSTLLLLLGAVGFVLVIACANVANLSLARSTGRRREFAIRVAVGAERSRIVRQILTEAVLLSLAAGAVGLLLAQWGTQLILAAAPSSLPRGAEIGMDVSVLLFTLGVSFLTGILFGLAPAHRGANADPQDALKEGVKGAGGGRQRLEGIFVALETGIAVTLLAGAGLMMQSVWRLVQLNPGFNTRNVLTMKVALSPKATHDATSIRSAYGQLLARVAAVPGVQSAAITALVPLGESDQETSFWLGRGSQPPQDRMKSAVFYIVTGNYSRVMQIPLQRGPFVNDQDSASSHPVVVIDDVLAKHFFSGQDPVGQTLSIQQLGPARIVGVVGHVKQWGLDSDDTNKIRDQIYFPLMQVPDQYVSAGVAGLTLLLRSRLEPVDLVPAVRAQVAGPTQDQPTYAVQTMEETVSRSLAEPRFIMLLLIIFAGTCTAAGCFGDLRCDVVCGHATDP